MKILAIETSCDETAICLLEATEGADGVSFSILGNITHSQVPDHQPYGGVFPALAKREHIKNLPIVLEQVLREVRSEKTEDNQKIDYICVTSGPGLEPALWTGIVFAKELGEKWGVPVVPVNHMEGHILSVIVPELTSDFSLLTSSLQFPALALLISGGHTELVLVKDIGDYEIIGKTVDDAVGEAFDKVARILGLPYPGGPEVSRLANLFTGENKATFPRPMLHSKDFNFSFSGLKTAVLYYVRDLLGVNETLTEEQKASVAHEFQEAAAEVLSAKTKKAVEEFGAQTLIVAGGVSANARIKEKLLEECSEFIEPKNIHFPARELTGDNALMIALAGYFKIKKSPDVVYHDIKADGNLSL